MLNGVVPTPEDQAMMIDSVKQTLQKTGKKREMKIPEGFLDVKGNLSANITGELKNKAVILQSLDSIFKTVVSTFNPNTGQYGALQDPALSRIFNQIIDMSGMSPLSTKQAVSQPDMSAIAPAQ